MSAVAVQAKENNKAVKAAANVTPEAQTEDSTQSGAVIGMPLFLNGAGRTAAVTPPPNSTTSPQIQRQPDTKQLEPEEMIPGKHGNVDIQRQPVEEEEEKLLQPQRLDSVTQRQTLEEEEDTVQPKLTIGQPGDEYEHQADSVAEHVMRMPQSASNRSVEGEQARTVQAKTITPLYIQRLCSKCEDELLEQKGSAPTVQSKPNTESAPAPTRKLTQALQSPTGGTALPPEVQSRVGGTLGSDLSHVRVHSDNTAQEAARSINAKAFTHRNHIYLGRGESDRDVSLMAHEATHVVQQGAAPQRGDNDANNGQQLPARVEQIETGETGVAGNDQEETATATQHREQGTSESQPQPAETEKQQAESQQQPTPEEETQSAPAAQAEHEEATQQAAEPTQVTASAAQGAQEVQSAEVDAVAETVETESGGVETGGEAGTETAPASDRPGGEDTSAATLARIAAAPDTILKPHVASQAELINADSLATELQLTTLAEQRRQEVSTQFLIARVDMVSFVESHIAMAQQFIAAKQEQATATTTNALAMAQVTVLSTMATIEAQSSRIAAVISGMAESAAATVQSTVGGIAGQIANLINSIPLPDLPGVEQARRAAAGLVSSAAAMVNNSLGRVLNMIRRALSGGMNLLNGFLRTFRRMIDQTFALMSRAINHITQTLFRMLNRVLTQIVSTLRRVLYGVIIPTLLRVESSVIRAVTEQERQSLEDVRTNRRQHLDALAAAISLEGGTEEGAAAEAVSIEDWVAAVEEIGRSALSSNRLILQSFIEQTSGFAALFITTLRSVIGQIIQAIVGRVTQMITSVIEAVSRLLQNITQMVDALISFLQGLIQGFLSALERVVEFVRNAVQRPVDELIEFAGRTLARIRDTVSRYIGRLFGGSGPTWAPSPMPIPVPIPTPVPPIPEPLPVPVPVPAPVPTPTPTPTPSPGPTPDEVIIILIIVVVLIILLILLYLLYKWLTRPRLPAPPKPPKKPSGKEYDPGDPYNVRYSVPLVKNNIQASAGEKLIFGVQASDKDRMRPIGTAAWTNIDPGTGPYEIEYQVDRDADFLTAGSGKKKHIDPTLESRNIYLFIENTWRGRTITVTATIKDKALPAVSPDIGTTRDTDHTITWTIIGRANTCPTGLTRVAGPGAVWTPAPARYTYEATPEINPPGRPNYENQTVLESFANTKANGFTMADLKASWKAANPTLNTPDKVANYLYGVSNNGTFVFNNRDRIRDKHDGFGTTSPFEPAALNRASGVGYQKDQTYSCASTSIGACLIERRYSTAAGIRVRKSGP